MDPGEIYLNTFFRGERLKQYETGKFCPVYLGDVLNDRYSIFRKLGSGSQSTVWLARDKRAPTRRFAAIKVFSTESTDDEIEIIKLLGPPRGSHPGEQHIELALDTFFIQGPNGRHFCKVVEPLGCSLYSILDQAFEKRSFLNEPEAWLQRVVEGDPWSVRFAKRACWQILQGLDYLHNHRIAHRDLHTGNICSALQYDLPSLSENEIQQSVWPVKKDDDRPGDDISSTKDAVSEQENTPVGPGERNSGPQNEVLHTESEGPDSDSDSESLSSFDRERQKRRLEFRRRVEQCKKIIDEQWRALELNARDANKFAEAHSTAWNKANFLNSRSNIELIVRADEKQLGHTEIRYIVAPTCLADGFDLDDSNSRLVLTDLGLACRFEDCEQYTRTDAGIVDFMAPEWLMGFLTTHKADIFSLGLIFWEVVMLRRLVEGRSSKRSRLVRDLAHRLGPIPDEICKRWKDAEKFLDTQGRALSLLELEGEEEEEEPGPHDYDYGDIWYHAKWRKPLDMSDKDMELFVDLLLQMMQWRPESRPATSDLLKHEWFKDLF